MWKYHLVRSSGNVWVERLSPVRNAKWEALTVPVAEDEGSVNACRVFMCSVAIAAGHVNSPVDLSADQLG